MDPPVSNGHVFAPKEVSIPLLVETTTKLFPGLTIQSRPCRPKAGFGLVRQILYIDGKGSNDISFNIKVFVGHMGNDLMRQYVGLAGKPRYHDGLE